MEFKTRYEFEQHVANQRATRPPSPIKTAEARETEISATLMLELLKRLEVAESFSTSLLPRIERLERKIDSFFPKTEVIKIKSSLLKFDKDLKEIMAKVTKGKTAKMGNSKDKAPLVGKTGLPKKWNKSK